MSRWIKRLLNYLLTNTLIKVKFTEFTSIGESCVYFMCSFVQQLTLLFPESARFHYSGYVVDAHQVVDVDGEVGFHHRATANDDTVSTSLSILSALATGWFHSTSFICVQSFGTTSNSVYRGCTTCKYLIAYIPYPTRGDQSYSFH